MSELWKVFVYNLSFYGITENGAIIIAAVFVIILIVLMFILFKIIKFFTRQLGRKGSQTRYKTFLVKVPKYSSEEVKDKGEMTQQELVEKIAAMETFFSNIGGIKAEKGIKKEFLGKEEHFSFEIVLLKDLIYFYITIPLKFKGFFEQQITAQFPKAQLEDAQDYNIFYPNGYVKSVYFRLAKEYVYPFKTYKKLQKDPLNAIVNTLSKQENVQACIQLVLRSAPREWHSWGKKVASEAKQGKSLTQAISSAGGDGFLKTVSKIFSIIVETFKTPNSQHPEVKEKYVLSQMEEEALKGIEEKASLAGLEANLRIVVSAKDQATAENALDNIANAYSQFNIYEYGNGLKFIKTTSKQFMINYIYRYFDEKNKMILNTEEVTSLFHFPYGYTQTPNIVWLLSKDAPAPQNIPSEGLYLGDNIYRGQKTPIYIQDHDRQRHMYIVGMTGTGKSKWMDMLALQDIKNGEGMCFIDPHGDDVDYIMSCIPKERAEDVIVFDPADFDRPLALNMLEYDPTKPQQKIFAINEILAIFDKLYDLKATGGPMFEQYMRNALMLIMDDPESGSTLLEVSRVLADEDFRAYKLEKCKTPVVKDFWEKEAQKAGGEASLANMVPYITSKLTPFIANDLMRPIISQQHSSLNFRKAMDEQKIILVKLAKGKIGDINANLLGMIIIGKILMAALGRSDMAESERKNFYLYIDEFQNFLTESINVILSEARKYRLCLTIAHQFLGQLGTSGGDEKIKKAIFGNVGTKACFRIGVEDSEEMAKEFTPVFDAYDLMNSPAGNNFIKIMVDNSNPPPFNMKIPWVKDMYKEDLAVRESIIQLSRLKYGRARQEIEAEVMERAKTVGSDSFLDELLGEDSNEEKSDKEEDDDLENLF